MPTDDLIAAADALAKATGANPVVIITKDAWLKLIEEQRPARVLSQRDRVSFKAGTTTISCYADEPLVFEAKDGAMLVTKVPV